MSSLLFPAILLFAGAFQLLAALMTHRRVGPLRTLQARQLEATLGRRGAVIAFALVGSFLVLGGLWAGALAFLHMG